MKSLNNLVLSVPDAEAMAQLGGLLAKLCRPPFVIYLQGDIGAGKTTLIRALLQAAGIPGRIKSPSFALLETYTGLAGEYVHLDLYRLSHPEELFMLGIRDYLTQETILAIEWPEQGGDELPKADLLIQITWQGAGRRVQLSPKQELLATLRDWVNQGGYQFALA